MRASETPREQWEKTSVLGHWAGVILETTTNKMAWEDPESPRPAKGRILVSLTKMYFLLKNNQRSYNQMNAFIILALKTFVSILTFFLAYLKTSLKVVIR